MILLMHLCYHWEVLHTIDIFALKMEIFAGNHPKEFTKFLTEDRENIPFLWTLRASNAVTLHAPVYGIKKEAAPHGKNREEAALFWRLCSWKVMLLFDFPHFFCGNAD